MDAFMIGSLGRFALLMFGALIASACAPRLPAMEELRERQEMGSFSPMTAAPYQPIATPLYAPPIASAYAPALYTPVGAAPYERFAAGQLYLYPNRGQSPKQQERDRIQCSAWATRQSGYSPANPAIATIPPPVMSVVDEPRPLFGGMVRQRWVLEEVNYRRAFSACMAGRGYTVE